MRVDRTRLPQAAEPRPFIFPHIEKSTLENGLDVWSVRHDAVPVVTVMLLMRRGAADDPDDKEGLAALTVDMLDEGSDGRSAIEMHEALARIGAQLDSDIGSDAALLGVTILERFVPEALSLMAAMVVRPTLTEPDFMRVRQLRLHRLTQLRDMPGAVADRAFARLLFGNHPYGHTPLGTETGLNALTVNDIRRFHADVLRPSEATLVVVGDCRHAEIDRLARAAFADWNGAARAARPAATPTPQPPRLHVVPRAAAPQSELRIGHVAVARDTPDYHALVAANMVLGGQFVSRINLNLREDKGLTYGARTAFEFRRLPGLFSLQVSVDTAGTAQAIAESIGEITAIRGPRAVTGDELALGVAALTRGYARNFETADQVARAVTQIALHNLPDDYFTQFVPRMARLTPEEVTRVAATHLHPEKLTTLVVGDFAHIADELGRLNLGETHVVTV